MGFLLLTALVIAKVKDLFAAVMLTGIFGLLCASLFVVMHAVDVALTEAVVGAGISTLLMLKTLTLVGRYQDGSPQRFLLALVVVVTSGVLLIYGTWDMPPFGSASAPIHQHVVPHYIQNSMQETGVQNIVTSILASYRGFDTFGELLVIFAASVGVLGLLTMPHRHHVAHNGDVTPMHQHMILRIMSKILIPFILIFALYIQFHGDYGPGGGFQAGVIFASAFILYSMLFGSNMANKVINRTVIQILAALGVLIFGSIGIISLLMGSNFLDYSVLLPDPVEGQLLGILLIELGLGITVSSVMIIIFFSFNEYVHPEESSPC